MQPNSCSITKKLRLFPFRSCKCYSSYAKFQNAHLFDFLGHWFRIHEYLEVKFKLPHLKQKSLWRLPAFILYRFCCFISSHFLHRYTSPREFRAKDFFHSLNFLGIRQAYFIICLSFNHPELSHRKYCNGDHYSQVNKRVFY